MVSIDMIVSTGQLVVTSQVPIQGMTYPSINATNPFVTNTSTNHRVGGDPLTMSGCGVDGRVNLVVV